MVSIRKIYGVNLFFVGLLLIISVYLQWAIGLIPCPLCLLQRLSFALLAVFFLLGFIFYHRIMMRFFIDFCLMITSFLGCALAARHVWLQYFPSPEDGGCIASIQYMLQVLPFQDVLRRILAGGPECSERGFTFLILNVPEWSLIWFSFFFVVSCFLWVRTINELR